MGRKSLDLQQDWLIQPYEQKREKKCAECRGLPVEKYQSAAKELGLDFRPYRGINFLDSSTLRVRLDSGAEDVVHPENIGIIWSGSKAFSRTNEFDDVLINPHYVQRFLNTKQYVHRLLEDSELTDHLPKSVPYGMGIVHDIPALIGKNGKVVYKPNSAAAGQGGRIFSPADLERVIDAKRAIKANERLRKFFDKYCDRSGRLARKCVELELNGMEMYAYLLQEFIPSKGVRSSETEQDHDSCIRAIVFDGEFIDAYHRLSPTPLSSAEDSSKYIGNLSNGALAEVLSDDDKELVADFSERVVRTLEDKLEGTDVRTKKDFDKHREDFWRAELAKVASTPAP